MSQVRHSLTRLFRITAISTAAATMALCAAAGTGCSSSEKVHNDEVATRADPTADFTAFESFAVVRQSMIPDDIEIPEDATINVALINDSAKLELIDLGLREIRDPSVEEPDLWLFNLVKTEDEDGVVWECVPGYWWSGWGWVWDSCRWLEAIPVEYTVGTVVVGLVDPVIEDVVFGGVIQGVADGEDVPERIQKGVEEVFAAYPADQTGP